MKSETPPSSLICKQKYRKFIFLIFAHTPHNPAGHLFSYLSINTLKLYHYRTGIGLSSSQDFPEFLVSITAILGLVTAWKSDLGYDLNATAIATEFPLVMHISTDT